MTNLLIKAFVRDYKNTQNEKVRMRYGVLSGAVGKHKSLFAVISIDRRYV